MVSSTPRPDYQTQDTGIRQRLLIMGPGSREMSTLRVSLNFSPRQRAGNLWGIRSVSHAGVDAKTVRGSVSGFVGLDGRPFEFFVDSIPKLTGLSKGVAEPGGKSTGPLFRPKIMYPDNICENSRKFSLSVVGMLISISDTDLESALQYVCHV